MRVFSTPIFVFLLFLSTFVTFHARISNRRYSCRSATIGSRFAALTAGKNPKMIPISMENTMAMMTAGMLIATGTLEIRLMASAKMIPVIVREFPRGW